ncbi:MAG: 3-keto-disaccharide hydrolase [Opitutales bacterium]
MCHASVAGDESGKGDENGFVPIFNGNTLDGWEGDPVYWRVEDGHMVGEITPETLVKRNTFIIWQELQPADFELKLEYRISKEGNSGVNYRSEKMDDHPFALSGYQADIDGRNRYTGQNYEERGRTTLAYPGQMTVIPPLKNAPTAEARKKLIKKNAWTPSVVTETLGDKKALVQTMKSEDWNHMHIVAVGNRLQHYVNGVLLSDVTDNDPLHRKMSGYIGVQVHVGPPMKVEYRNIRLKVLN